jgi:hypothetical protein
LFVPAAAKWQPELLAFPFGKHIGISASSGNVAAVTATATLPALAGRFTYLCGFSITSGGSAVVMRKRSKQHTGRCRDIIPRDEYTYSAYFLS